MTGFGNWRLVSVKGGRDEDDTDIFSMTWKYLFIEFEKVKCLEFYKSTSVQRNKMEHFLETDQNYNLSSKTNR